MSEESKTVHDLKALDFTLGEGEAKPRRHRKPSLARTIKSAEKRQGGDLNHHGGRHHIALRVGR